MKFSVWVGGEWAGECQGRVEVRREGGREREESE
jgi:hypothetical protein